MNLRDTHMKHCRSVLVSQLHQKPMFNLENPLTNYANAVYIYRWLAMVNDTKVHCMLFWLGRWIAVVVVIIQLTLFVILPSVSKCVKVSRRKNKTFPRSRNIINHWHTKTCQAKCSHRSHTSYGLFRI